MQCKMFKHIESWLKFSNILDMFVQIMRLEMTWRALRRNHTETAVLFEKKLKPFMNLLNDGDGEGRRLRETHYMTLNSFGRCFCQMWLSRLRRCTQCVLSRFIISDILLDFEHHSLEPHKTLYNFYTYRLTCEMGTLPL